ncbi:hypothetical protein PLICRDRAFT_175128 [Plicaturopsis crispa FD-325 SS-3]|nr:hypothetical protein PLICRDRAFT_175128 [Plicaturopsis crispa FD-325 SS-3]
MSTPEKSPDGDEPHDTQSNNSSVQPSMTIHPISYSGMPMHMFPYHTVSSPNSHSLHSKRRQVKNACTNCQKACKKCDDARPCLRCVKYGFREDCHDSHRKERKKGIKRGPYKKRDGKGSSVDEQDAPAQTGMPMPPNGGVPPSASPPMAPYMGAMPGYPGFYSQYPPPQGGPGPRPGEGGPPFFPHYYIPVPHAPQQQPPQENGDGQGYPPPHAQFYPATFLAPYPQPYPPPYMMPHPGARQDGPVPMQSPHYAPYPPMYSKAPSADDGHDNSGPGGAGPSARGGEGHDGGDGKTV